MYNPLISDHDVSLPDPAVVFEGKQVVNTNDHPQLYLRLQHALHIYDRTTFVTNLENLYRELDVNQSFIYSTHIQQQLQKAVQHFDLKQKNDNISYKIKNKQFNDEGYWDTSIDTDDLNKCLEKDIEKLEESQPIRNTRIQDKIVNLPKDHTIFDKLNKVYTQHKLLPKPFSITDINLHISDNHDTFNEYFQNDQRKYPHNKLYTLHIDPKYNYIKSIIYLNEVTETNGPFAFIPRSHRWEFDSLEMFFAKSNQLVNTLSTPEDRAANATLPIWARKNTYFSRQFEDEDPLSQRLLLMLKHFTSDKSNFILFEPNYGWHRGTHVSEGKRIALQVILKPC